MVFEPTTSCIKAKDSSTGHHEDTGYKENIKIKPNSCFSDLSDSMEFHRILHNTSP